MAAGVQRVGPGIGVRGQLVRVRRRVSGPSSVISDLGPSSGLRRYVANSTSRHTEGCYPMFMDKRRASATVLVVEDDDDTRIVYSDGLGYAGYRVITASTGVEGLRAARDEHPDVILLDLSLTGADGWEVVRCLKASRLTGDIPVLLVTGYADLGERAEAEGCAGFLTKPIRLNALRTAIASVLPPVS